MQIAADCRRSTWRDRAWAGLSMLVLTRAWVLSAFGADGPLAGVHPSSRVLFIGNSFADFNRGVDQALQGLEPSIAAERVARGGYTLENHWGDGPALSR